jgi:Tfp pilus assembly protein PilO
MVQQTLRLKILILPLSLVVAVMFGIFFLKPAISDMLSAQKDLSQKQNQLDSLKMQTQKLSQAQKNWEAMSDDKTLVESALPEKEDVDSYISELFSKASRSGIYLSDLKKDQASSVSEETPAYVCGAVDQNAMPDASASAPIDPNSTSSVTADMTAAMLPQRSCVQMISISMSARGSWEQMLDFLRYLQDMSRVSNIGTVAISSQNTAQPDQNASDVLGAQLSINVFFKNKSLKPDSMAIGQLASQGDFSKAAIEKLRDVVYAPYTVPSVSPGGERNLFK